MSLDYETEYNNRARVPEYADIFARWEREGAAWRAAAPKAELGLKYGPSQRQTLDIFPTAGDGPNTPLALFIHGGWWRSLYPSNFSQMAKGPNAHGVSVAVAGYELCPTCSIGDIVGQMRAATLLLWRRYRRPIMVYGHSAGGHLAACMVATNWKTLAPDAPADLVPAAYAISGVYDLSPLIHVSQNADLKLNEEEARRVSVLHWAAPAKRTLDAVVGGNESSEFLRQSKIIADAWAKRGIETRYEAVPGADHFTVIDPLRDPQSAMTARVVALAGRTHSIPL